MAEKDTEKRYEITTFGEILIDFNKGSKRLKNKL